ncbi:MAG: hypothetical protein CL565_03510 [Alphaproteobacteria bacterium]|nr:hypothetical protein [Alphaproteobacteria bacterium]|tara:strand:+ start:1155 stop:1877 length:723 start_codon:yes stop_codon:yes gene_type:complete
MFTRKPDFRPVIGITGSRQYNRLSRFYSAAVVYFLGGRPRFILPGDDVPEFEGLIISGGIDVHPDNYDGKEKKYYKYDIARDKLEFSLFKKCQEEGKPVVGICRGAQLINISRGGTLFFDISKMYEKIKYPTNHLGRIFYRKAAYLDTPSLISELAEEKEKLCVNSLHTQAINLLGSNLEITAKENNGVVQVIEDRQKLVLGVQFHPELMPYKKFCRNIFKWLISNANSVQIENKVSKYN